MVLILANQGNQIVDKIVKWLSFYNVTYLRITRQDIVDLIELTESDFVFRYENTIVSSKSIVSYFNFNSKISIRQFSDLKGSENCRFFGTAVKEFVQSEIEIIEQHICFILETKSRKISNGFYRSNKLCNLYLAKEIGLNIPETLITSCYKKVSERYPQEKNIITKIIGSSFHHNTAKINCKVYTQNIYLANFSNKFGYSLFQNNIEKEFEIRVFYLKGKFYSMAIFSQSDEQTKVDFRRYINNKPNRTVPYTLDNVLQEKLDIFMKKLYLDTGSIDLIKCKSGNIYFLEVNPYGQFGDISYACNCNIENDIAKILING